MRAGLGSDRVVLVHRKDQIQVAVGRVRHGLGGSRATHQAQQGEEERFHGHSGRLRRRHSPIARRSLHRPDL